MFLRVSERPSRVLQGRVPMDPLWCALVRERRPNAEKALSLVEMSAPLTHQTAPTKQRYVGAILVCILNVWTLVHIVEALDDGVGRKN